MTTKRIYAGFFYTDRDSQAVELEERDSTFVVFAEAEDPKAAVDDFRKQIFACGEPLISDSIYLDAIIEVGAPAIVAYRSRRTPPRKYQSVIAKDIVRGDVQAFGWSAKEVEDDEDDSESSTIEPFITLGDWLPAQKLKEKP